MRTTIDHIRSGYGTVEAYATQALGLDETVIAQLRDNLLEDF